MNTSAFLQLQSVQAVNVREAPHASAEYEHTASNLSYLFLFILIISVYFCYLV